MTTTSSRSLEMVAMLEAAASVRLPEQSDSSSDEEGSPRKRRRSTIGSPVLVEERCKNDCDNYVRSGSRLKSLASNALAALVLAHNSNNDANAAARNERDKENTTESVSLLNTNSIAAQMAREKTAECLILEKKLKEADAHNTAMMAANASLRESATALNERMERTVEALRIAGTNAVNARADADAAEAYAASLASQLESLRHVVEETKRATKILHDEHETVASATRSVESKLLQRETEMHHFKKDRKTILADREKLKCNGQDLIEDKKKLERQVERRQERIKILSRELDERDALEKARKDRSSMVEKELRDARAMLVDASTTAVETETTTSALNETILTLQQENQTLHGKIEEIQDRSRRNEERLQDTLVKTERGAQSLRIKATAHDEQIQRVLSEKVGCEKQVTQLKTRVTNLERRLKESVSFMSPAAKETVGGEPTTEKRRPRKSFQVPPLTPGSATTTDKSPASASRKPNSCSLCFKSASGLMKTCQCGKPTCDKRAHSTCLAGAKSSMMSISHPGTPSPRLPVILCTSPLT